ncbi:unnamed protein product [Moneuplotes crassus]|uniref:Uncharacterized protein n=1 Tax=Euplotes crassus TaxID=5936 RepID=A0AAD1UNQ3_EUPCR|nr:unnamed protein product [Moneuplotes crassus]
MNRYLVLFLLVPCLVAAQSHDVVTVGMKAFYTKKALEQTIIDTPMEYEFDNSPNKKLLIYSGNVSISSPHPDDIKIYFDEENNTVTMEIVKQKIEGDFKLAYQNLILKQKFDSKVSGKINKVIITLGVTTHKVLYTNAPSFYIKDISLDLNKKDWTVDLPKKWNMIFVKPFRPLLNKFAMKNLSKLIKERIEESIVQQFNEEFSRVSGRFDVNDGALVDVDVLDNIQLKNDNLIFPYDVTYYLSKESDTTDQQTEECQSDCGEEEDSEPETEGESKETNENIFELYLTEHCFEENKYVKFCFSPSEVEQHIEDYENTFTKIQDYCLDTLPSIYSGATIAYEEEEEEE